MKIRILLVSSLLLLVFTALNYAVRYKRNSDLLEAIEKMPTVTSTYTPTETPSPSPSPLPSPIENDYGKKVDKILCRKGKSSRFCGTGDIAVSIGKKVFGERWKVGVSAVIAMGVNEGGHYTSSLAWDNLNPWGIKGSGKYKRYSNYESSYLDAFSLYKNKYGMKSFEKICPMYKCGTRSNCNGCDRWIGINNENYYKLIDLLGS